MTIAFILVNCDLGMGTEQEAIKKLKNVPGVIYVSEVSGFYDIVVKITSGSLKSLKETISRDIRTIETIRSTMTLIAVE
jgi:DNA-binding Lrp family transcriptional regulator